MYKKELIKAIKELGCKYGNYAVFQDMLTMTACAISNSVDPVHYEERERLYLDTVKKYSKGELEKFVEMKTFIVKQLELKMFSSDLLGEIYHELALHNEHNGQFFSPMHICSLMAKITLGNVEEMIKEKGFITLSEPTCGSGAMVIAAAGVLNEQKLNHSTNMCVCAVDNDIRCTMMAYIQLSLLGIPAVVIHGDSLLMKEYSRFYTPAYILNNWIWKQQCSLADGVCMDDEKLKCISEPMYGILKYLLREEKKK